MVARRPWYGVVLLPPLLLLLHQTQGFAVGRLGYQDRLYSLQNDFDIRGVALGSEAEVSFSPLEAWHLGAALGEWVRRREVRN
jgi:hypothetical protein